MAQNIKRETECIDPWQSFSKETEILEFSSEKEDNRPFTLSEQELIRDGLSEVKKYIIQTHNVDPDLVDNRIDCAIEASTRLGKKDWKSILTSVLFGIMIDAYLPAETARDIFRFVGTVLKAVLQQQGYLPQ